MPAGLMLDWSIEVSARQPDAPAILHGRTPPGTQVYVTHLPDDQPRALVATAAALRRAGFEPVPHVAVRALTAAAAEDFLARAAGEAGVTRALVIGGDLARPRGPFSAGLDLLATGLLQRHGIRAIGVAAYPEGSPRIAAAALDAALAAKLAWAQAAGVEPWAVTQFCFEAAPILAWLDRAPAGLPVRIGLAGPARIATLARYALRCGVGNSVRALGGNVGALAGLLGTAGPDRVVDALAAGLAARPPGRPVALHLFPFGGLAATLGWIEGTASC